MNTISERPEAATTVTAVPETSRRTPEPYWNPYIAGMGLGLVNAKAVVESHGGSIELAPRSPRGTRVTLRIPSGTVHHG